MRTTGRPFREIFGDVSFYDRYVVRFLIFLQHKSEKEMKIKTRKKKRNDKMKKGKRAHHSAFTASTAGKASGMTAPVSAVMPAFATTLRTLAFREIQFVMSDQWNGFSVN